MSSLEDDLQTLHKPRPPGGKGAKAEGGETASSETASSEGASGEGGAATGKEEEEIDLRVLAEKVYTILKRQLFIERERLGRTSRW